MVHPLPLPRVLTVVVVTAVAVALVVGFRVTPHVQKGRLAMVKPAPRTSSPAAPAAKSSSPPSPSSTPATRRITGTAVMTEYGPVQVRLTMRGGRIVSITNLALPFDRNRSQMISQAAGPLLRSEALAAQSARIDVVSGATYTSNGYAQSLQSALDRAHG
ncbi:MAG TPA: FMN-binding protein [Baekduia sp.]|uniref:FMN-binding protein n=1 Tax=Baekduia sp. TaxID=2600305 RepID=UPI002BB84C54|nr:FMN-binding protein [Baekduia sp.]HMJ37779.1 FMN-binding protein [Baekduia sp.]